MVEGQGRAGRPRRVVLYGPYHPELLDDSAPEVHAVRRNGEPLVKSLDSDIWTGYRAAMASDAPDWWAILRGLDEPVEQGTGIGWEIPREFDRAVAQAKFDQLASHLSQAYRCRLAGGRGPEQESASFGGITIPAEVTATRAKRTRGRFPVTVVVSNFGGLAAYVVSGRDPQGSSPPVHQDDRMRIEDALGAVGYNLVPAHVLDTPYDGPNADPEVEMTWYDRYFSVL